MLPLRLLVPTLRYPRVPDRASGQCVLVPTTGSNSSSRPTRKPTRLAAVNMVIVSGSKPLPIPPSIPPYAVPAGTSSTDTAKTSQPCLYLPFLRPKPLSSSKHPRNPLSRVPRLRAPKTTTGLSPCTIDKLW